VAPLDIAPKLSRRFALPGVAGVERMALSALDIALWDALAVAAGLPLATLLGSKPKSVPAYNSSGLGLMSPRPAARFYPPAPRRNTAQRGVEPMLAHLPGMNETHRGF
jgi:L-alanine-DL-glutamate epimerase-like enolase superfamily enzyme